jgi:hypothetical protein
VHHSEFVLDKFRFHADPPLTRHGRRKFFHVFLRRFFRGKGGVAFFSIFLYYIVSSLVKRSDKSVALCCKTARWQQKAIAGRRRARACVLAGVVCRARQKENAAHHGVGVKRISRISGKHVGQFGRNRDADKKIVTARVVFER